MFKSSLSDDVKSWTESLIYVQGDRVYYNGNTWEARWWNFGDPPGIDQWSPWVLVAEKSAS